MIISRPVTFPVIRRFSIGQRARAILLAGVSVSALLASKPAAMARGIGNYGGAGASATETAVAAAQASAQSQAAALARATASLNQATQAILAAQAAQAAAHNAAVGASKTVPDGLKTGGLVPVSNPVTSANDTNGLHTWDGASLPTQSITSGGKVEVSVNQFNTNAILTWLSFNIGSNTILNFNQPSSSAIALNRVLGSGTSPSQILGQIQAPGTVLIINQNGSVFGGSAQIKVGSLMATSLDTTANIQTNNQTYLGSSGFSGLGGFIGSIAAGGIQVQEGASITANGTNGSGGLILLAAPEVTNAGYLHSPLGEVALAAGDSVGLTQNTGTAGSIDTNVRGFIVGAGLYEASLGGNYNAYVWNQASGLIEADQGNISLRTYMPTAYSGNPVAGGTIQNDGVLYSTTSVSRNGSITIGGANITFSTTSVIAIPPDSNSGTLSQAGSSSFKQSEIVINGIGLNSSTDSSANITFQSGSLLYAPAANVTIGGGATGFELNNALVGGVTSIFIDSGAVIDVAGLANIALPASANILTISQLTNADFADTPLLRNGFLVSQTVYVDPRLSGVSADGVAWIGTPLLDASAYAADIKVGAAMLMTTGGNITINNSSAITSGAPVYTQANISGVGNASSVVIKPGAVIDFSGGWITYQAGMVRQTQLIEADGAVVNIGSANPLATYVGIYNGYTVDHSHWSVVDTYVNPIHQTSYYEAAYSQGYDAGSLLASSPVLVPDGTFYGLAFAGAAQTYASIQGSGTSKISGDTRPLQASYNQLPAGGYMSLTSEGDVEVTNNPQIISANFELTQTPGGNSTSGIIQTSPALSLAQVPLNFGATLMVSPALAQAAGLSELTLSAPGNATIDAGVNLTLTPGGTFNLSGRTITISGNVTVPSGTINIKSGSMGSSFANEIPSLGSNDITINGELSVAGLLINNDNVAFADYQSTAWQNGGTISITPGAGTLYYYGSTQIFIAAGVETTVPANLSSIYTANDLTAVDNGGSVYINPGALLNLTSGAAVNQKGIFSLAAKGGNLTINQADYYFQTNTFLGTLQVYKGVPTGFRSLTDGTPDPELGSYIAVNPGAINARVVFNPASIEASGFGGGGTFTLETPDITLGTGTPTTGTELPLNFFSTSGFATYNITSYKTVFTTDEFSHVPGETGSAAVNGLGGFNALLGTQTLTIGAGQTLALTQSVLSQVLTQAQSDALVALPSGGNVLSVVSSSVPSDAYDQKPVNLTLGGLIELNVAAGGRVIGSANSALTVSKLYNQGDIRIPGGTITQQEILPLLYYTEYSLGGIGGSVLGGGNLAIGVNSLSQVFTYSANGTIDYNAIDAIPSGLPGAGLTNGEIAGNEGNKELHAIYFLGLLRQNQGIVLAPGSVTDLSGTFIANPRATGLSGQPLTAGTVVAGGSIVALGSQADATSYNFYSGVSNALGQVEMAVLPETFVAEPGSIINLSGASASIQQYSSSAGTALHQGGYITVPIWSDGGSLVVNNGATLTGAIIQAQGGAPQANGGTLEVQAPVLVQTDPLTPTAGLVSANMIESAGFQTLIAVGSIGTLGNVTLNLRDAFFLEPAVYGSFAPDGSTTGISQSATAPSLTSVVNSGGVFTLNAPLISLNSVIETTGLASGTAAGNSLFFNANTIVVTGSVDFGPSVANATLAASNAIVLTGVEPSVYTFIPSTVQTTYSLTGSMTAAGNLNLIAGQIYPATGSNYTISSTAANGTITIGRDGTAVRATPYSAGGNLGIYAANIVQDGVIQVPLGTLTLGSNTGFGNSNSATAYAPATLGVTLGPDSVTSVSLDGLKVPYGVSTDQIEWYFASGGTAQLTAPPPKILNISATNVTLSAGATVDLTGGGDVYAYEFVPGPGGSRDVLSRTNTSTVSSTTGYQYPDGRQIYAIVPGLSRTELAAYDPVYSAGYSSLYAPSQAGEEVYLSAAPGLAAGWYTLLPAQYALLPGGMRIVQMTGATNVVPGASAILADGSELVSGYFGNALAKTSSSTPVQFSIENQTVIHSYSDIRFTSGTALTQLASTANNLIVSPPIAADAAQLVLNPLVNLSLNTTLSATPGTGGRGSEVDISGLNFDVVSDLAAAPSDGAIHITAASLTNLGASSLLIGATRTNNTDGTTILAVTAQSITVSNNASTPLSAAEVVLAVDDLSANSKASNLILQDDATIIATGTYTDKRSGAYIINAIPAIGTPIFINQIEYLPVTPLPDTGTGALFRVANAPQRLVQRDTNSNTPIVPAALLQIGNINAKGTSISFDTSNNASFGSSPILNATNIAFGANAFAFTSSAQPTGTVVVTPALSSLLSQATNLVLHAQTSISFDNGIYDLRSTSLDAQSLVSLQGGTVKIDATSLGLGNGTSNSATQSAGQGTLNINATSVTFGSGTLVTQNFGAVDINATGGVFAGGSGGALNMADASLTITAPYIGDQAITGLATESAYTLALTTTGNVTVTNAGTQGLKLSQIAGVAGSAVSILGNDISISGTVLSATAGRVDLSATGSVTLANNAVLQAPGFSRAFGDAVDPVTKSSPGGNVYVTALGKDNNLSGIDAIELGNAKLLVGSGTGNAGTLSLNAPNGSIDTGSAAFNGVAGTGGTGGSLSVTTLGSFNIGGLNQLANATGFTSGFSFATSAGNLELTSGTALTSGSVSLTADGGLVLIDQGASINTTGVNGGNISLYGSSGVTVAGSLLARATGYGTSDPRRATGGTITIGTDFVSGTASTNPVTGQVTGSSGAITVKSSAVIDVSSFHGGDRLVPLSVNNSTYYEVVQGDAGGTVDFRAPVFLNTDSQEAVNINIANATLIKGATSISVQGFER